MRSLLLHLGLCLLPWLVSAQTSTPHYTLVAASVGRVGTGPAGEEAAIQLPVSINSPADTLIDSFFDPNLKSDARPAILMKTEPGLIALSVVGGMLILPGAYLYIGCHSYTINGRKKYVPSVVEPLFLATRDHNLQDLYKRHRQTRIAWYAATSGGLLLSTVGFIQVIAGLFNPAYSGEGSMLLLSGAGLTVGGQVARVISFQQLRKAVNLYNTTYATTSRRVSLHLGLPSRTPAGGALYLRF